MSSLGHIEAAAVAAVAAPTLNAAQYEALNVLGDSMTAVCQRLGVVLGDMHRIPGLPEVLQHQISESWQTIERARNDVLAELLQLQIATAQRHQQVSRSRV